MKKIKLLAIFVVGMALTTASCKKTEDNENNDDNNVKKTCYVNKIDFGEDYSLFEYNSEHQVIKITEYDSLGNADGSYAAFTYADGKLSIMENWDSGSIKMKLKYHYGASGKADTLYQYTDQGNGLKLEATYVLTFTGDNLTKAEGLKVFYGQSVTIKKLEFTYNNGNAIMLSDYEFDLTSLSLKLKQTSSFEYDTKKNPYNGIGLNNFFIAQKISFMSVNNPIKSTIKDKDGIVLQEESENYSYEYSNNDYPTKVTSTTFDNNNIETTIFTYDCQ